MFSESVAGGCRHSLTFSDNRTFRIFHLRQSIWLSPFSGTTMPLWSRQLHPLSLLAGYRYFHLHLSLFLRRQLRPHLPHSLAVLVLHHQCRPHDAKG